MRLLYKHENMMIMHSIKNILELQGIDCLLKNEHGFTMGAEFGIDNTRMELWLPDEGDYTRAHRILTEQILDAPDGEPWACAACGELNDGHFGACWSCQQPHETEIPA